MLHARNMSEAGRHFPISITAFYARNFARRFSLRRAGRRGEGEGVWLSRQERDKNGRTCAGELRTVADRMVHELPGGPKKTGPLYIFPNI